MANWITCPGCGLKHSPRPDGLCPRCRARAGAAESQPGLAPQQPFATQPFPPVPPPPEAAPLPTTAWGGGAPPAATAPRAEITVGSLVSRTFSTWWANVGRFALSLLVAYAPLMIAGMIAAILVPSGIRAGHYANAGEGLRGLMPLIVIAGLATLVVGVAQFGGVTYASLQHLAGRRSGVGAMYGAGFRRVWPLFATVLAAVFVVWLGLFLLIVPGIILALALTVSVPVIMAEDGSGVGAAFRRSFALTKGSRLTLFLTFLVILVAMWGLSAAGNVAATAAGPSSAAGIVVLTLSMAIQIAIAPLLTVMSAVAYHDLRVAKEGVDTSQLARVFE